MNSNRGNNRRRSRGSNNRSQGGSQLNRIDSRARGNAPQMLDKYRKLAQDASLNGDRVQAEYYLQFADHYFRVIADSRTPKEEFRGRSDQRDQDGSDEDGDFDRGNRGSYDDRFEHREPAPEEPSEPAQTAERELGAEFEPPENPFVRDNRGPRSHPREERRPRRPRESNRNADGNRARPDNETIDAGILPPAILPPAIKPSPVEPVVASAPEDTGNAPEAEAPKPRRRTRRTKADGGEALEKIG